MIGHGKTDIVAMGRQMLDPETGRKVREPGRGDSALHQLLRLRRPALLRPSGEVRSEPRARPWSNSAPSSPRRPRRRRRSVVGGGPAGLEVARVGPCEGTTSPSSKRRATWRSVAFRGAALRTRPSAAQVVRARCAPGGRRPHRHDRNPRGGCCALLDHVVVATGHRTLDAARGRPPHVFDGDDLRSCSPVLALPGRRGSFRCRLASRARHRSSGRFDRRPGDPRQAHRAVHAGRASGDHRRWSRRRRTAEF